MLRTDARSGVELLEDIAFWMQLAAERKLVKTKIWSIA